ncbi:MAG: short-chain dehydrogenase, partial [Cupriavidus sp.]|nr:short-chain dehydrogenase [Cupriavidus sp.]
AAGTPEGVGALHPGWVKTDMGGQEADLTVQQSVKGMRQVLASVKRRDNGTFHNYDGTPIPW